MKVGAEAAEGQRHGADMEAILWHEGQVFTTADDGKVKIWSEDLVMQREWQAHDYAGYHMVVMGGRLITASIDSTIKVWNLETLECLQTLRDHEDAVRKLAATGDFLYSGDEKGIVIKWIWTGIGLKRVAPFEVLEEVWDLCAQGNFFVNVRDRGLSVTETKDDGSANYTKVCQLAGRHPLYLGEGLLVHATMEDGGKGVVVKGWQLPAPPSLGAIKGHDAIITCAAGGKLRTGEHALATGAYDNKIKVWKLPSGEPLGEWAAPHTPSALCLGGGRVFVGGPDGYLVRLDMS